jgi:HTH-type transcriptional regulator / antitoxin HigA
LLSSCHRTIDQKEVFPPGEFLKDELDARGWTQTEFAEIIDCPIRAVNELILGKRAITPETANEIAAALGTSAQTSIRLTNYQRSRRQPNELPGRRRYANVFRFAR